MKLLSLKVENFRCIRAAAIEFGDGLNVLYGPNDLGKSSLAHAVRAALLLPPKAADHVDFVSWYSSEPPVVELVFETEPQRIYRVKKTFGTTHAFLEASRDGVDFSSEARGREVDEQLTELLKWGIAPPGGKGRPKGMPLTFLTAALLAEQDRVGQIFSQKLADDSDESGKKLLISALNAMAEDRTFRAVLERVHERFDLAFSLSADGNVTRRRGKNSPWAKINEEITKKQQHAAVCAKEVQETEALKTEFEELQERRIHRQDSVNKAEEELEALQRQARLGGIALQLQELAAAEKAHQDGAIEIDRMAKAASDAQASRDAAVDKAQKEKAKLDRLQSKDRARERQLEQSKLEARRNELESELLRLEASLGAIRAVEAATAKVRSLESELSRLSDDAADLRKKQESAAAERASLEAQERELRGIQSVFRWQAAREQVGEADKSLVQVNEWRTAAGAKRAEAAKLRSTLPATPPPARERIDQLRHLASEIRIAAAKLEVGVEVRLQPHRPLHVRVQRDDERARLHELKDAVLETTARRALRLHIEGVAEILLSGGAADARDAVEALEKRWAAEAQPLLDQFGVAGIGELARLANNAEQVQSGVDNLLREAAQLKQRIADQPDWSTLLEDRRRQFGEVESALAGADLEDLQKSIGKLKIKDAADAERRLAALRAQFEVLTGNEKKHDAESSAAAARVAEKQKSIEEARGDLQRAASAVSGDWKSALGAIQEKQTVGRQEMETIAAKLTAFTSDEDQTLAAAKKAVAAANNVVAACDAKVQSAQQNLSGARLARATKEGQLTMVREAIGRLDPADVQAASQSTPVTPEQLNEAERAVNAATAELLQLDSVIHQKRGALQQVGGEVARERADDAQAEFEAARERARRVELEYDAWALLRQTLREAEQEEGTNLGNALSGPILQRFAALTAGRYGKLALGPNLETQGISVAGGDRLVEALSVGTRDQLSTIFRLTLAEQLMTAVMLDDQLAQSDSGRMTGLRDLLKDICAKIQVIVLTCRPEDYGIASGKRGKSEPRSVDLAKAIQRWTS